MDPIQILVGRRVIFNGEVVTIIKNPKGRHDNTNPWIRHEIDAEAKRAFEHWVSAECLRPLPDGNW